MSKDILKILADEDLVVSMSQGRRLIQQGAVKVDGKIVGSPMAKIEDGEHTICVGKEKCIKISK